MQIVADILKSKPDATVHTIDPATMVFDAMQLMTDRHIGALVVTDGAEVVGIVTERDYAQKIALMNRASRDTPVRDIMTAQVISVGPQDSADHCMQLVTDSRIRHLPVLEGGQVIGVVSIGDLVKAVIEEQRQELDHLQRYIAS